MTRKLAIAAAVIALMSVVANQIARAGSPDDPGPESAAVAGSVGDLDPVHGLRPLADIVELWRGRAEAQPLDYLSRTQLGIALHGQARETADLDLLPEAETALREALTLNPDHGPAHLGLASVLVARHHFAAAADQAQRGAGRRPRLAARPGAVGRRPAGAR